MAALGLVAAGPALGGSCDVSVDLVAGTTTPADGATVDYSLRFCDASGFSGDVFNVYIGVSATNFEPGSSAWVSCPTGGCSIDGQGSLGIGGFTVPPSSCVAFTFRLRLQPGLGGHSVCLQASTSLKSTSPPTSPFPCNKRSDDPATGAVQDATCVQVQPAVPGCSVAASVEPRLLATCAGSGDSLSAQTSAATGCPGGTLGYQWLRNGTPIGGATASVYVIPPGAPPGGAQYRCLVSCAAEPACQGLSNQVQVTIFPASAVVVVPPAACVGEVAVYVDAGVTCTIDCGSGQPAVNACFARCRYAQTGRYVVQATAFDGNCTGTSQGTIDISTGTDACIGPVGAVCEASPGPTRIPLQSCSSGASSHQWSTSLGSLDDPTRADPTLTLPDIAVPTQVTVSLTAGGGCGGPDSTTAVVDVTPSPAASAGAAPQPACAGEDVQFTGGAGGTGGPFAYAWDFGDGQAGGGASPTHAYQAAGSYVATLTVTDTATGCTGTATVPVEVEDCCPAVLPELLGLSAVKGPTAADVTLAWVPSAEARDGYNVWKVEDKTLIDAARAPARPGIDPACLGVPPGPAPGCVDVGASPATGPALYYQARSLCGSSEGG
jgi:hypothetical protein